MKIKKRFYILPKTKIGKISFWLVILSFIGIYLNYWIAMAARISMPPLLGILPLGILVICGITSFFAIIKYRDYAILLFLSALIGLLGILFVLGEFLFPH